MSDELELAKQTGVTLESLAKAPVWLAAGVLGVPALIAIAAGYFIAKNVNQDLKQLNTYNLSEIYQLNEISTLGKHNFTALRARLVAQDYFSTACREELLLRSVRRSCSS